jgi:hypothetical protein
MVAVNEACGRPIKAVEVGVDEGKNSYIMLKSYRLLNLIGVDIVKKDIMVQMLSPFENFKFLHKTSIEAASEFPDNFFDFVYIDDNHDYANVTSSLTAWYPKVKNFGVFSGHDWWYGEVEKAVFDFLKKNPPNQRLYGVNGYFRGEAFSNDCEFCDWWFIKRV